MDYKRILIDLCVSVLQNKDKQLIAKFNHFDLEQLLKISFSQKVFPIIYEILKNNVNEDEKRKLKVFWLIHSRKVNKVIEQTLELKSTMQKFSICKGYVLSQILYDNPYMRMFADIDIYVPADKLLSQCLQLEKLGYSCEHAEILKNNIDLKQDYINIYYSTDGEKKFNRHSNEAMIEVKDWSYYFSSFKIAESESNGITININGYKFNTFNLRDSFILSFENMHSNFFTSWGIKTEYTLRDIVDMTAFIIRYPELFTEEFLFILKNEGRLERLGDIIQIIRTTFSLYPELIERIPKNLLDVLPASNEDITKEVLFDEIFNSDNRIEEWDKTTYKSTLEGDKYYYEALNLNKSCYDYKNGIIELVHPCIMNRVVNSSLRAPIYFSSDYDKENIIFSYCISKKYPHLQLCLSLLKDTTEKKHIDEIVVTFYHNGDIKKGKFDINFDTYITDFEDSFILSVVIKKENISLFKKDDCYEVYFSFKLGFPNENIDDENFVARTYPIGQPTIKIPIE